MKKVARRLVGGFGEVFPKVVEDELANEIPDSPKSSHPDVSSAERYLNGELALHIHMSRTAVGSADDSQSEGGCLVFQTTGLKDELKSDAVETSQIKRDICPRPLWRGESCRVNDAVLIGIPKGREEAEFVPLRPAPSLVRLSRLDECNVRRRDPLQSVGPLTIPSGSLLLGLRRFLQEADGELVSSVWTVPGSEYKLPDQMVETRAHVVDSLPSDNAESSGGMSNVLVGEHLQCAPLIWLRGDAIGAAFDVIGKFFSEEIQLLLRPIEFGPTPFQRSGTHVA